MKSFKNIFSRNLFDQNDKQSNEDSKGVVLNTLSNAPLSSPLSVGLNVSSNEPLDGVSIAASEMLPINTSSAQIYFENKRRKTLEEKIAHRNEYQKEYLKKWRAKKKKDEETMKKINQAAINTITKILNYNSHIINEEDKDDINNTSDYFERCTKIIELLAKIYTTT